MKPNRSILPLLLAGMLRLGFSATAQNPPVPSPASPIIAHGPLLLNPSSDGADIVWFTDRPCVSWVEYGAGGDFKTFPQFGGPIKIARTVRHGLVEAGSSVHRVRIKGPVLNEGGVDVVLSGHYHKRVKFEPAAEKNTFPVLGGPVDGVIKAWVRPNQISIQVIDLKGFIVDQVNLRAKTGNMEREGLPSR